MLRINDCDGAIDVGAAVAVLEDETDADDAMKACV